MAAAVTQRHLNDDNDNFTKSIKSQSNWKILVVTQRCVSGFISSVELGHVRPKSFQRWRIVLSLRRLGPAHDAKRRIISSTLSCLVSPAIETSLTFIQLVCFAPIISYLCIGSHLVFFLFFFLNLTRLVFLAAAVRFITAARDVPTHSSRSWWYFGAHRNGASHRQRPRCHGLPAIAWG